MNGFFRYRAALKYGLRCASALGTGVLCAASMQAPQPRSQGELAEIRRLADLGDWKKADDAATALAARDGTCEAYEMLGRVKDGQRRFDEAEAAYRRAMELNPRAGGPYVGLGMSYVQRGRPALALEQFQQALAREPANLTALLNAGSVELSTSQFAEAEKHYLRAKEVLPNDSIALLGLATAAFGAGHRDLALATASLLASGASPAVRYSLGVLLAKNALYAEAARQFEAVEQQGASSLELFVNLGLSYSALKRFQDAKAAYFKAVDLNASDPIPYTRIGADYLDQKKGSLALAWLFRAVKLGPAQPEALFLLGRALLNEEYFQTAQSYLERYARLRTDDPTGWLLLGDAFLNDEQPEKALDSYQKALHLVPRLASAHYLVGNAAYLAKRTEEAKAELRAALRIDPSHAEAQLRLGEIAYHENAMAEAAKWFQSVLKSHPDDAEAAYDLAKVCVRQDQFGEARDLLEKAVSQRPADIRFHYLLSQAHKRLGEDEKSEREWSLYRTIKSEEEFQHRFIRHSHLYVE